MPIMYFIKKGSAIQHKVTILLLEKMSKRAGQQPNKRKQQKVRG